MSLTFRHSMNFRTRRMSFGFLAFAFTFDWFLAFWVFKILKN